MFEMGTDAWAGVARTLLVYVGVFVGLRLAGKRELGQMTVFDLVAVLLIANPCRTRWWARTSPSRAGSSRR